MPDPDQEVYGQIQLHAEVDPDEAAINPYAWFTAWDGEITTTELIKRAEEIWELSQSDFAKIPCLDGSGCVAVHVVEVLWWWSEEDSLMSEEPIFTAQFAGDGWYT